MNSGIERTTVEQFEVITEGIAQQQSLSIEALGVAQPVAKNISQLKLNFKALAQAGYLTPDTMQGNLAEKYRFLLRRLLWSAIPTNISLIKYGNLIAITSALSGEGKTYISFNLAMSIATSLEDSTVLLVDCDLANRSITKLVGLTEAPGLTNILVDSQLKLSDVIVHTNLPKLKLIPAGTCHGNIELLAVKQMSDIANQLSEHHPDGIILFDTMPLLSNSQTLYLTGLVGKVLIIVEEGKTLRKDIKETISLLDSNQMIGFVLNKCSE